jgi:hypothetical protein
MTAKTQAANNKSAGPLASKAFAFSDAELTALQNAGRQLAQICNSIGSDTDAARNFLEAAIKSDRATLLKHCGGDVQSAHVGSITRTSNEAGVREASCQIRYNVGRFRLSLAVEEQ